MDSRRFLWFPLPHVGEGGVREKSVVKNYFRIKPPCPGRAPRGMKILKLFIFCRGGVNPLPTLGITDSNFFRSVICARLGAGGG